MKRIFRHTTDGHYKQWAVHVEPRFDSRGRVLSWDMVTEHGKIGTTQRRTVKAYSSEQSARAAANQLVQEKLGKGYRHYRDENDPATVRATLAQAPSTAARAPFSGRAATPAPAAAPAPTPAAVAAPGRRLLDL